VLPRSCEWLHDFNCDGKNWRFCKGETAFDTFSGDKQACIRVLEGSVHEIKWVNGERVDNAHSDCTGGSFYGTLDQAKAKCVESSKCEWLHDYNCDGQNWRFCNGKADITPVEDGKACTMVVHTPKWARRKCSVSCKITNDLLVVTHDTRTSHKTHKCYKNDGEDCTCLCYDEN
jgi:hypothetical protein